MQIKTQRNVAVLGAGKIGTCIAALLNRSGRYRLRVADIDPKRAESVISGLELCEAHGINLQDPEATKALLSGCDAVISALPFHCNKDVARYAYELGINYLDLTEDVATSHFTATLADGSSSCFMPQCGLAPGFISIAAHHLVSLFDTVQSLKMRVGALPIYPTNRLKYNMTWSTEGLINEYANLCEVIQAGKRLWVLPLEGYEHFSLDGDEYEAFNTAGGLGTLCSTLEGKLQELNYKSIRYPGHHELMSFLMYDLGFTHDREGLRKILDRSISTTAQDKCMILVEATGFSNGLLKQKTYASTIYNQSVDDRHFGAIQVTTAASACAALDLLLCGKLPRTRGLIKSEEIPLLAFLENEFGKYYLDEKALGGL